ncbi:hypothetical protein BKA62DRAFT_774532 [Auriculariales sp. MPI-PUGE-AT-0066]|nr:hypothetical protein BKA62DRAFT_774532 [Auriculariales sp. MPI-PUGE-AT-0066]
MFMKVIASALSLAIAQDIGLALTVQYTPHVRAIDVESLVNKPHILPAVFSWEISGWGAGTSITRGSAWGNEFVRAVRGRVEYATDPFTSYQATAGQCTSADDVVRYLTQSHLSRADVARFPRWDRDSDPPERVPLSNSSNACKVVISPDVT